MRQLKIGFKIQKIDSPEGKGTFTATIPLASIFEKEMVTHDIKASLKALERDYTSLVDDLLDIVSTLRSPNALEPRVLLYWQFGDRIEQYEKKYEDSIFFLDGMTKHLVRDVGVSEKILNRCRRFRKLYPDKDKIDPRISFDRYVSSFEGGYISSKRKRKRGSNV